METSKNRIEPEKFYHIYNRGINGQNIFFERNNYSFFFEKYAFYVSPFFDTYAYCLLPNHFHFLVYSKSEEAVRSYLKEKHKEKTIYWIFSNAFSSLFQSYAQSINKIHKRTGHLFERPFHRIEVNSDLYFTRLIYYIHTNPQKHGFVEDFIEYEFSSYHSHLLAKPTKLKRNEVLEWFGGEKNYIHFHNQSQEIADIQRLIIEF